MTTALAYLTGLPTHDFRLIQSDVVVSTIGSRATGEEDRASRIEGKSAGDGVGDQSGWNALSDEMLVSRLEGSHFAGALALYALSADRVGSRR